MVQFIKSAGRRLIGFASLLAAASGPTALSASTGTQGAQITTRFVRLAPGAPAVLYEPATPGNKASVAVVSMHSSADYLTHSSCTQLARRGYRVLCANNSTGKAGVSDDGAFDRVLLELKAAVLALRAVPGVRRIVLMGHSGGGSIMSAYQMIAEGGLAACQGAEKITRCPDSLAGLPAADGLVLSDSNWGLAVMSLFSVDPAVTDERSGMKLDHRLDMFDPRNGFVAGGSRFSPQFTARFLSRQGARARAILARAQERLRLIEAGKGLYADDEPFDVPGASLLGWNNKLFTQDTRLISRSLRPWPLVHADGSVTIEPIHSVRTAASSQSETRSYLRGALKTTVRNYLTAYAIRTTPDFSYGETSRITGVDWRSNYANAPGNVQSIAAPLLTLGMTGGWEGLAAETIHDLAVSRDKSIFFIEGATHVFTTCKACERVPGQFGDTEKTTYDTIDRWLAAPGRFLGD